MSNKAILLKSYVEDSWEVLYINDELKESGDPINGGYPRISFFVKLAKKYDFKLEDLIEKELCAMDEYRVSSEGVFPDNINEFEYDYEKDCFR